jgi:hypothetical protein
VLTVLIATVIAAALWHLLLEVLTLLRLGLVQAGQASVFQAVFGQVATVLIALVQSLDRRGGDHTAHGGEVP